MIWPIACHSQWSTAQVGYWSSHKLLQLFTHPSSCAVSYSRLAGNYADGSSARQLNCPLSLLTARQALPLGRIMLSAADTETPYKLSCQVSLSLVDFTGSVTLELVWTIICSKYANTSIKCWKIGLALYRGSTLSDIHPREICTKRQLRLCIIYLYSGRGGKIEVSLVFTLLGKVAFLLHYST